jgi:O-methyltransferase
MKSFEELHQLISPFTLISRKRCEILYTLANKALETPGHFYECGVYKGGSALLLANIIDRKRILKLFDTFTGMPEVNPEFDQHVQGDFKDTSLESVMPLFTGYGTDVCFYKGLIPHTFPITKETIAFAHVDVDIYQSVLDCCEYITPRLSEGGIIVFDDYGFSTCPGAKKAVDEYYEDREEWLYILNTKQAVISKQRLPEIKDLQIDGI